MLIFREELVGLGTLSTSLIVELVFDIVEIILIGIFSQSKYCSQRISRN